MGEHAPVGIDQRDAKVGARPEALELGDADPPEEVLLARGEGVLDLQDLTLGGEQSRSDAHELPPGQVVGAQVDREFTRLAPTGCEGCDRQGEVEGATHPSSVAHPAGTAELRAQWKTLRAWRHRP